MVGVWGGLNGTKQREEKPMLKTLRKIMVAFQRAVCPSFLLAKTYENPKKYLNVARLQALH